MAKATKFGTKVYVCSTTQGTNLNKSGFEALAWVQVGSVGNYGEFGAQNQDVTYATFDEFVTQHQKGTADIGTMTIETRDLIGSDAGQIILSSFAATTNAFEMAVKIEKNDKATVGGTNTILYSRGLVSGPKYAGGDPNTVETVTWSLMLNQDILRVNAT